MKWLIVAILCLVSCSAESQIIAAGSSVSGTTPLLSAPTAITAERYAARPNGFDRTGVCDGTSASDVFISSAGSDAGSCGSSGSPCATFAGLVAAGTHTAGADVCISGTIVGGDIDVSDLAQGTASNPIVISARDADNDEDYDEELATIQCDSLDLHAVTFNSSFVEFAHVNIDGCGIPVGNTGGAIKITDTASVDTVYVHDVRVTNTNVGYDDTSGRSCIDLFATSGSSNIWIQNLRCGSTGSEMSGYGIRGGCDGASCEFPVSGLVVRNVDIDLVGIGTDVDFAVGVKVWGPFDAPIFESIFIDGNAADWDPLSSVGVSGIVLGACVQDATIDTLEVIDARSAVFVQPWTDDASTAFCEGTFARPTSGTTLTNIDAKLTAAGVAEYPIAQMIRVDAGSGSNVASGLDINTSTTCGLSGQNSVYTAAAVPSFTAAGNTWDLAGSWTWAGVAQATLAGWQTATSTDAAGTTAVDCDYPVAGGAWAPESIGLDDDFEGRGPGSTEAILLGSTLPGGAIWDGLDGTNATTMLAIEDGSTATGGVASPGGGQVLSIDSALTNNAMIRNDDVFDISKPCRYTNRWVFVKQPSADWSGVHGWQNFGGYLGLAVSENFPDRVWTVQASVVGNPAGGFRSAPQFYRGQERSYDHPTDDAKDCTNIVGVLNGNHWSQDPRSVALGQQSEDSNHHYQIETGTWFYNEQKTCSLHVNAWDPDGNGSRVGDYDEVDESNDIPIRTFNRWWNTDGTIRIGEDDYYDQGSSSLGTYIGSGPGRNVLAQYALGECHWAAPLNDWQAGNNGQAGNTLTEGNVIVIDDPRAGASDIDRPNDTGEPWWAPRNGFPDAP